MYWVGLVCGVIGTLLAEACLGYLFWSSSRLERGLMIENVSANIDPEQE